MTGMLLARAIQGRVTNPEAKMTETKKTRRDLEDAILRRACSDETFQAALLADPREAVASVLSQQFSGAQLPPGLTVKVIEEPANTLTVVVPTPLERELSNDDLEHAAGGALRPIAVIG